MIENHLKIGDQKLISFIRLRQLTKNSAAWICGWVAGGDKSRLNDCQQHSKIKRIEYYELVQ